MWRATVEILNDINRNKYFNPRPRVEGDGSYTFNTYKAEDFNPRPRVEGDTFFAVLHRSLLYFNPRPRVEGDRLIHNTYKGGRKFQSSPSCGGRRDVLISCTLEKQISILALVWRATTSDEERYSRELFQSSPSCGGRRIYARRAMEYCKFQSSPSCGGRLMQFAQC